MPTPNLNMRTRLADGLMRHPPPLGRRGFTLLRIDAATTLSAGAPCNDVPSTTTSSTSASNTVMPSKAIAKPASARPATRRW